MGAFSPSLRPFSNDKNAHTVARRHPASDQAPDKRGTRRTPFRNRAIVQLLDGGGQATVAQLRSYSRYQLGRRPDQAGSLLTKQVQLQKLRRFRKAYSDLNAGLAYFPAPTTPTPLSIIGTAALMRSISAASFSTAANASRSKP